MSTAEQLPIARGRAPLCACGCGHRVSTIRTTYIMGHAPRTDPVVRFWNKVEVGASDDCWPWRASLQSNGYACFTPSWPGPKVMAHRFAYEDRVAPIPDGLTIDHLCRNRACMNPAHMEVVTLAENVRRGRGWEESVRVRRIKAEVACGKGHSRSEWGYIRQGGNWRCRKCRSDARKLARKARAA